MHKVTLRRNYRVAILERTNRYHLLLNGGVVGDIYYNTHGYVITPGIPLPDGRKLQLPECGITKIRREIARINREAKG